MSENERYKSGQREVVHGAWPFGEPEGTVGPVKGTVNGGKLDNRDPALYGEYLVTNYNEYKQKWGKEGGHEPMTFSEFVDYFEGDLTSVKPLRIDEVSG